MRFLMQRGIRLLVVGAVALLSVDGLSMHRFMSSVSSGGGPGAQLAHTIIRLTFHEPQFSTSMSSQFNQEMQQATETLARMTAEQLSEGFGKSVIDKLVERVRKKDPGSSSFSNLLCLLAESINEHELAERFASVLGAECSDFCQERLRLAERLPVSILAEQFTPEVIERLLFRRDHDALGREKLRFQGQWPLAEVLFKRMPEEILVSCLSEERVAGIVKNIGNHAATVLQLLAMRLPGDALAGYFSPMIIGVLAEGMQREKDHPGSGTRSRYHGKTLYAPVVVRTLAYRMSVRGLAAGFTPIIIDIIAKLFGKTDHTADEFGVYADILRGLAMRLPPAELADCFSSVVVECLVAQLWADSKHSVLCAQALSFLAHRLPNPASVFTPIVVTNIRGRLCVGGDLGAHCLSALSGLACSSAPDAVVTGWFDSDALTELQLLAKADSGRATGCSMIQAALAERPTDRLEKAAAGAGGAVSRKLAPPIPRLNDIGIGRGVRGLGGDVVSKFPESSIEELCNFDKKELGEVLTAAILLYRAIKTKGPEVITDAACGCLMRQLKNSNPYRRWSRELLALVGHSFASTEPEEPLFPLAALGDRFLLDDATGEKSHT